jgi:hypothetical protein
MMTKSLLPLEVVILPLDLVNDFFHDKSVGNILFSPWQIVPNQKKLDVKFINFIYLL